MTFASEPAPSREGIDVSVATILWVVLGSLFVSLRFAGVLSIPIGGVELDHLSGAWQAHAGNDDARFVPTLFQAVTAWAFAFTTSEMPARILAFLASATVPFALYRLRAVLGEPAALIALGLLAVDPASILLGSTAWAGAFDVSVVVWLAVVLLERPRERWLPPVVGFAVATSGAVVLPPLLAWGVLTLFRADYPTKRALGIAGIGAVAGVMLASVGFGFGWEGLTIPPLLSFADGFERAWSSESTRYLAVVYQTPLLAAGLAAAAYQAYACWREDNWPEIRVLLLTWAGFALAWLIVSGGSHDPTPLAGVALPFAILLALQLPDLLASLSRVDWRVASAVTAAIIFGLLVTEAWVVDWARVRRAGDDHDKLVVTGLVIATLASAGMLASNRKTAPALAIPVAVAGGMLMLSGASAVAFGGPNEPLPSPIVTAQGREVRDIAVEARKSRGGLIVVHPSFKERMTWPLRDSGSIVLASRVPPDATVLVWPANEPAPEGFAVVEGDWSLVQERHGPDGGFLDYLQWLSNRNSLKITPVPVAVYQRTSE